MAKSTDKLKYVSYLSVGGTVTFIVCVFVAFFMKRKDINYDEIAWLYTNDTGWKAILDIFINVPTLTMAFTFQFNFFSYYKAMENASDKKMKAVSLKS